MSATVYRSGSIKVYRPKDEPTITSAGLASLVFAASTEAWSAADNNDRRSNLDTSATYQVIVSALWHDPTNLGYMMVQSSGASGPLQPTTGQGIRVSVAPGAWPANYAYASFIMVWLKKNSGEFQLHSIYPPDTQNTWAAMLITECQTDAITKSADFLTSTTTDSDYPKRTGGTGVSFENVGTTQDGVELDDAVDQIQYRPDTSSNYSLAVTRGFRASFSILNDNMSDFVAAGAGEYSKFAVGANTYEISLRAYQAASAVSTGCRPWKFIFPIDSHKAAEVLYLAASYKEIQSPSQTRWGKQDPPTLSYVVEIINNDTTLQNVHVLSSRILYAT